MMRSASHVLTGVAGWLATLALCLPLHLQATESAPSALQDARGRSLEGMPSAQRVVSLLPSLTETVCVLGACERLVGVDRFSNWPSKPLSKVPVVGGGLDPNVEAIVALRPDVVLMSKVPAVAQRLEALGVRTVVLEPRTLAEVETVFAAVAQVLGVSRAQARNAWSQMQDGVRDAVADLPAPSRQWSAYFEVSPGPFVAGASSFLGELMAQVGLRNVVPAHLGPFPRLSPEFLLRAQPQILLIGHHSMQSAPSMPGWRGLDAVKAGRVCTFTAAESDVLVRPGPRMGEAARLLVRCLQQLPVTQTEG